ncbi:RIP metalloprotease RseP [Candidatus Falkowbacteria bacterium]|nr:MAG: RIP metalloprotease RseP [Candidatus Falkowbacteria bacterium]
MFLTIITFLIVLSLLVFVHEFGHFWVARRFGLKPEEFGFGFPPRAWGIYRSKEGGWKTTRGNKEVKDAADTIYSVNWLPLGGFVKLGEDDIEETNNPNHFNNKPIWQRAAILLAGVTMNVVLAAVLISFGFMVGLPQATEGLSSSAKVSREKIQIIEILPDSPADEASLEIGDIILEINNNKFIKSEELQKYVAANTGRELVYKIESGGEMVEKRITPKIIEETQAGGIGVGIVESGIVRYPVHIAIWEGLRTTFLLTWFIIVAFYDLIKGLILGQGVSIELGGPVKIAQITGDAVRMGFAYLINFAALLSINLAIINAFPFPALDGGRILFLIIEKIKGSPVKKEVEAVFHNIGFALLMLLILLITYKDIARIWQ